MFSEGFKEAKSLGRKLVAIFNLSKYVACYWICVNRVSCEWILSSLMLQSSIFNRSCSVDQLVMIGVIKIHSSEAWCTSVSVLIRLLPTTPFVVSNEVSNLLQDFFPSNHFDAYKLTQKAFCLFVFDNSVEHLCSRRFCNVKLFKKNWLNCSTITFLFAFSGNSCLSNSIMTGVSVHWRLCWGAVGTCYSHTNKLMDKVKPERKFSNFAIPLPSPLLYECCFGHETWGKLSLFGLQLSKREGPF